MRFEIRHTFPCPPERLWEVTDSEEFERRLAEATGATRVLLEQSVKDGSRYTKRRISMKRDLPAPMRKALGTDEISYDQETWRPVEGDRLRWQISPKVLGDRFSGTGTTTVRATPAGCERIIAGDLQVKVPLIGGAMEKRLVDDVTASYERAAKIALDMLAE
ncbi:MAG: DUF2505 domain-containing protein [Myxococcales bacterium]|nr:DUF2505 domain-containing protein [Myxococcales bacterium]MCB9519634.1 DUF2505 domain-containing protein [Myxococcales bacterium]MCB9530635.1 DUF2505 domain-containing protein [Myxococcales bacterium]